MPNRTSIAWTDRTSNPLVAIDRATGKRGWFCTKVSAGCQNCYAEKLNKRFGNGLAFTEANMGRVEWRLNERELEAILRLREPQRIFLEDMGDLFHEDIPPDFIFTVLRVIATQSRHTFQVLTKRPERMRHVMARAYLRVLEPWGGPLPNLWLGVSVENQGRADERIPLLLETPAAVRFVSCEPLLGPLDLRRLNLGTKQTEGHGDQRIEWNALSRWEHQYAPNTKPDALPKASLTYHHPALDQVIVGGESAGPEHRRLVERCQIESGIPYHQFDVEGEPPERAGRIHKPCNGTGWRPKPEALERVRGIRDQCHAAGVVFFFKQWGGPTPKSGGCLLDGREHKEMPRQEVRA